MISTLRRWFYRVLALVLAQQRDLVLVPVLFGPARGMRFQLHLEREGHLLETQTDKLIREFQKIFQPGWVVWDFNIGEGYFTVLFSRWVTSQGMVCAFDSSVSQLRRTQANAMVNGSKNLQFFGAIDEKIFQQIPTPNLIRLSGDALDTLALVDSVLGFCSPALLIEEPSKPLLSILEKKGFGFRSLCEDPAWSIALRT